MNSPKIHLFCLFCISMFWCMFCIKYKVYAIRGRIRIISNAMMPKPLDLHVYKALMAQLHFRSQSFILNQAYSPPQIHHYRHQLTDSLTTTTFITYIIIPAIRSPVHVMGMSPLSTRFPILEVQSIKTKLTYLPSLNRTTPTGKKVEWQVSTVQRQISGV